MHQNRSPYSINLLLVEYMLKISSLKLGIVNNELFRGDIKSYYNEFGTCGEMWENAIDVATKSWFCQNWQTFYLKENLLLLTSYLYP